MNYKSLVYGIVLALVILIIDVFTRVFISTMPNDLTELSLPSLNIITENKTKVTDVLTLYSQFDVVKIKQPVKETIKKPVITKKKKLGIGTDKENQQNGSLTSLYFGENKVTLSGIFSSDSRFAVVKINKLADKKLLLKKVKKSQKLFDYTVNEINAKSIKLSRNDQVIELKLFKSKSKS